MITVLGVFDEFGPAQSARNELLVFGFASRQVQLSPDHEVTPRERTAHPQPDDQSLNATMRNLVRGLFGDGNPSAHGELYANPARLGAYALMVDVDAEEQRVQAEDIIRRHGPAELSHCTA